jgi:hypothetical protein
MRQCLKLAVLVAVAVLALAGQIQASPGEIWWFTPPTSGTTGGENVYIQGQAIVECDGPLTWPTVMADDIVSVAFLYYDNNGLITPGNTYENVAWNPSDPQMIETGQCWWVGPSGQFADPSPPAGWIICIPCLIISTPPILKDLKPSVELFDYECPTVTYSP